MFKLKSEILRLLKEDEEFRYAVAGLIGLEEILRRLYEHDRKFNEILKRLDEHTRILNEHTKTLKEHAQRLEEHDKKFNEIMTRLSIHDEKFNAIIVEIRDIRRELKEIRTYMERTSLTLEEEAWEVLSSKLREMGLDIKLSRLILPDLEINIYGVKGDLCMIGEASVRAGAKVVRYVDEKISELRSRYPEHLRKRILKIVYTMWATKDAIEEARRRNIWLVRVFEDLTPPTFIEM